ncbi:MAG: GNAT family N-acetyltransferase, partial [Candidatus Bathyarchaeia archaeon]
KGRRGYLDQVRSGREGRSVIVEVVGGWLQGTPSGCDEEDRVLKECNAYNEAHLDWMAVKEEYREKGIGANLIQKVCSWAKEHGKKKIWTESSRDMAEFYEKHGFKQIGGFLDENGEKCLTMLKEM